MTARKNILVVDDDPDFVEINKTILETSGYQVAVAHDGQECLARARTDKPDLIILDIMMKTVGDGMFAAQALRQDQATKAIPIIVVTGVNQVPPFNIGPDDGWLPVDAFIEKPAVPQVLLEHVRRALGQATTRVERGTQSGAR